MRLEEKLLRLGYASLIIPTLMIVSSLAFSYFFKPQRDKGFVEYFGWIIEFLPITTGVILFVFWLQGNFESKSERKKLLFLAIANLLYLPILFIIFLVGMMFYCRTMGGCKSLMGF